MGGPVEAPSQVQKPKRDAALNCDSVVPSSTASHGHGDANMGFVRIVSAGSKGSKDAKDAPAATSLEEMKKRIEENLVRHPYDVKIYYHEHGAFQKIARSHIFENITLAVIAFNALWIWIDTDWNDAEAIGRCVCARGPRIRAEHVTAGRHAENERLQASALAGDLR